MSIAQANRFEILSDSFQMDDTNGPHTYNGNEKNSYQRIDEEIKYLKEKTNASEDIVLSQSHLQQSTENATKLTCLQRSSEHQSEETCSVQEKTASSRKPENSSRNKRPEVYTVGDSVF